MRRRRASRDRQEGSISSTVTIPRLTSLGVAENDYGLEITFGNQAPEVAWIEKLRFFGSTVQHPMFNADPFLTKNTYRVDLNCAIVTTGSGGTAGKIGGTVALSDEPLWAYQAEGEFKFEFGRSVGRSWRFELNLPILLSLPPHGRGALRLIFSSPLKTVTEEIQRGGHVRGMYVPETITTCGVVATTGDGNRVVAEMDDSLLVFLSEEGSVRRGRESHKDPPREDDRERVILLFMSADPSDASRLRVNEEMREIQEKLQLAKHRDNFELHVRSSARAADLSQALLDVKPTIVHFAGHGSDEGALCLESGTGTTHFVSAQALGALFEQFESEIQCVILNSCYSVTQAKQIVKHVPFVIGMNNSIGDDAAIAFSVGFYQGLGAGKGVPMAFRLGCVQIQLQGVSGELVPLLLERERRS